MPAESRAAAGLRVGDDVTFRVRISDAATGRPIAGAKPAAWLAARAEGEPRDAGSLTRKVAGSPAATRSPRPSST